MKIPTPLLFLLPLALPLHQDDAPMPAKRPQPKITPFLWFEQDAEEAMRFYLSVFEGGEVLETSRWGEGGPVPKGTLMTGRFRIQDQELIVLNGGPYQRFNESFSLVVSCEDQAEIDRCWDALTAGGGEPGRCGWLKDRYGLSWQVVPRELGALLGGSDPAAAGRAAAAMLQMGKLDLARLRAARAGD